MSDDSRQVEALKVEVMLLSERVENLERTLGERASAAAGHPHLFAGQPTVTATPPPRPAQLPPRPASPPHPPKPPKPPYDWGKLAEQLFAARTLAWAGGVATALGIVLLFVMAASRGWITPAMRVGIGVGVSAALLGAAIELDRRTWRSDAILAAAGVAIGGLYASLWAATSLYHLVASAAAAPLAGLIAALAVAVALRIRQEPLAVFGMSAAMLAPILVSEDVTTGGVLFAAVMFAAALPLFVRTEWLRLMIAVWAIGTAETLALLGLSADRIGFGGPVVAAAVMAALVVCLMFILELMHDRAHLSVLGSLTAGSAFTIALGATFLFGGMREAGGHSLSGITLAGLGAVWLVLAFVPAAVRRPHADLADLLTAFGLTSAAIATGLLAGGPALVCAWTAESAMLVLFAERIRRRSATRSLRAIVSAAAYLALGILATFDIVEPLSESLPHVGVGSTGGSIALVAVALAGIVLCFGLRTFAKPELSAVWLVPGSALAALPVWALSAERAVVAYAAMAAALLVYRRTRLLVALDARVGRPASRQRHGGSPGRPSRCLLTAPADKLTARWSGLGDRHGLAGLARSRVTAAVFAWSARRPARPLAEFGLLVPVATLAYLIAERSPRRMRCGRGSRRRPPGGRCPGRPGPAPAGDAAAAGGSSGSECSPWAQSPPGRLDDSLRAVVAPRRARRAGRASRSPPPPRVLFAARVPGALGRGRTPCGCRSCSPPAERRCSFPGQYPLVAVAGLSALASCRRRRVARRARARLDRPALAAIGAVGAAAVVGPRARGLRDAAHALPDVAHARGRPRSRDAPPPQRSSSRPRRRATSRGRPAASGRRRCSSTRAARSACGRWPRPSSAPSSSSPTPASPPRCTTTSSRGTCSSRSAGSWSA